MTIHRCRRFFEAKIGKASVLLCGFSIEAESIEERALIQSISDYSKAFEPECEIDKETYIKMIKE